MLARSQRQPRTKKSRTWYDPEEEASKPQHTAEHGDAFPRAAAGKLVRGSVENHGKNMEKHGKSKPPSKNVSPQDGGAKFLGESLEKIFAACRSLLDDDGRERAELFQALPSAEDYPDYYEAIEQPISLQCIRGNIIKGRYQAIDGIVNDMKVMFANARQYNVEGSEVHEDATALEGQLRKAVAIDEGGAVLTPDPALPCIENLYG
jgi:hypothetical protein